MPKNRLIMTCALLLTGGLSPAQAETDWSLSGNVALTSDYVDRGFTQTDAKPAIQGALDLKHESGFLMGTWASNVESDLAAPVNYDGSSMEWDLYLGWTTEIGGWEATAKASRFFYPGTRFDPYESNEFSLYLARELGPVKVNVGGNYSDDLSGTGKAFYWDFGASIPVGRVTLAAHYGLQRYAEEGVDEYEDYKVGVSGEAAGLGLDLSYVGTNNVDADCIHRTCAGRAVFTVTKSF